MRVCAYQRGVLELKSPRLIFRVVCWSINNLIALEQCPKKVKSDLVAFEQGVEGFLGFIVVLITQQKAELMKSPPQLLAVKQGALHRL